MIKKLRIKFILISIASIFLLLSLIFSLVNIINFKIVARDADRITLNIAEFGGEFKLPDNIYPPGINDQNDDMQRPDIEKNPTERGGNRIEAKFDTRYFSVKYDRDGILIEAYLDNTASFNLDEALALSDAIKYKIGQTGWNGNYRYRVYANDENIIVVYLDYTRELNPSRTVLITSLFVGISGVLISFILIYFISNIVIKPVDESLKKQKQFISNASHELKTPITIISANNEILELELGTNESTETIDRQVRKLSVMVKDLNTLVKIDEMEHLNFFDKINLSKIINETIEPFYELFNKENIEFNAEIEDEVIIKGDETMIKNLIEIIIENALKYTTSKALFTLKKDGERVIIEARNDAPSIKDGIHDEVFERFYRSDDVRSTIEGSGIGLSIAKEIVELHKGRIKAHGENGDFIIKVTL